jgi:hydrogenase-1 operon protein HyaF
MKSFNFFGDGGMVDALLVEVADLLARLIETGEEGAIDLLGLPLSPHCLAELDQRLGAGEVDIWIDAFGLSQIRETGFPGVWRTQHVDKAGRVIARLIEVATAPQILRADAEDMKRGRQKLLDAAGAERNAGRSAA